MYRLRVVRDIAQAEHAAGASPRAQHLKRRLELAHGSARDVIDDEDRGIEHLERAADHACTQIDQLREGDSEPARAVGALRALLQRRKGQTIDARGRREPLSLVHAGDHQNIGFERRGGERLGHQQVPA